MAGSCCAAQWHVIDLPAANGRHEFLAIRLHIGAEEMRQFPLLVEEVLAEIPAWRLVVPAILGGVGEPLVEGRFAGTLYLNFLEHGEGDSVVALAKFGDLGGRTWLLAHEVVAGETKHYERILVSAVEFLPVGVLRRITTLGGDVEDNNFLAAILGQIDGLSF